MTESSFCLLLGLVLLTGCPDRDTRPGKDDTSAPADGDTGHPGACGEQLEETDKALEQALQDLERVKAELVDCQAKLPEAPE